MAHKEGFNLFKNDITLKEVKGVSLFDFKPTQSGLELEVSKRLK